MNSKIKEGIVRLNSSMSIDEKVSIAKELLLNTDIVKAEDALCQFDDDKWYNEENYLKKFLEYKRKSFGIYNGVDCDVSLLSVVMYALLSQNIKPEDIRNQSGSKLKYEIIHNGKRFKGDTLTSALWVLKLYLGCIWKRIDSDKKLRLQKKYNDFYGLFQTVAKTGVPVAPTGNWNDYCYEHSDIIWNAMDKAAQKFLSCYNMFGNYMRIPGNLYTIGENMWTSFNMARSNKGEWDTVDTLLAKIFAYYKYSDSAYLSSVFTDKIDELTSETLEWLEEFSGWSDFIDKNDLSPFVDKRTMVPISLKTGSPISENELCRYNAIPSNYQEFIVFFEQLSKMIILRSENIYKRICI